MDYKSIHNILDKYFDGNTSVKEEKFLKDYFSGNSNIPDGLMYAKAMFEQFNSEKEIRLYPKRDNKPTVRKFKVFAIAAGIAIIIGFAFLFQKPVREYIYSYMNDKQVEITIKNETHGIKQVILSDNNIVWLNKGCEITYPKKINKQNNTIAINGEAFFEVTNTKSCDYRVIVENMAINTENVTSFNVNNLPQKRSIEVTVNQGAVKVSNNNSDEGLTLVVTQGNYCSVDKSNKLIFAATNVNNNYLAWKTGKFVFDNSYMATVTDILAEYYNIQIEFEKKSLAYCQFSGTFRTDSIEYILNQIKKDLNVEIQNTGTLITISGDDC